jgi:lysosomal acid phosphatase
LRDLSYIAFLLVAGRTLLHTILSSLERIAFNGDPLQFLLVETTYQPFISLFHETAIFHEHPEIQGIRMSPISFRRFFFIDWGILIADFGSALAIELLRGPAPEDRDFLRFKFKNGTEQPFQLVHPFGHHSDIPLTEFIYRIEVSVRLFLVKYDFSCFFVKNNDKQNTAISSNYQWSQICNAGIMSEAGLLETARGIPTTFTSVLIFFVLMIMLVVSSFVKRSRAKAKARRIRLENDEVSEIVTQAFWGQC